MRSLSLLYRRLHPLWQWGSCLCRRSRSSTRLAHRRMHHPHHLLPRRRLIHASPRRPSASASRRTRTTCRIITRSPRCHPLPRSPPRRSAHSLSSNGPFDSFSPRKHSSRTPYTAWASPKTPSSLTNPPNLACLGPLQSLYASRGRPRSAARSTTRIWSNASRRILCRIRTSIPACPRANWTMKSRWLGRWRRCMRLCARGISCSRGGEGSDRPVKGRRRRSDRTSVSPLMIRMFPCLLSIGILDSWFAIPACILLTYTHRASSQHASSPSL